MGKENMNEGFTIDDIHNIREENYEYTKDMTMAEKVSYYNSCGMEAAEEIRKRKSARVPV